MTMYDHYNFWNLQNRQNLVVAICQPGELVMPEKVGFHGDSNSTNGDTFVQPPICNIYKSHI